MDERAGWLARERSLAALARRQFGAVTRRQLLRLGFSKRQIEERVAAGRLHPIHRGVYLVGHTAMHPLARESAALLACGPDALLSHATAGALWDFPLAAPERIQITLPPGRSAARPDITIARVDTPPHDRTRRRGLPLTSAARTVQDLAARLADAELEAVVADGLRRRLITERELRERIARSPRRRGSARLRRVLDTRGGPAFTRSDAERMLLGIVREAQLEPGPQTNVRLLGRERDAVWPGLRLVVEVDGYRWHGSRTRFEDDRSRDLDIAAHGWTTIRLTVRQLGQQRLLVAARLGAAMALARQRAEPAG